MAATFPAARGREAPVREVPALEVPALAVPALAVPVLAALVLAVLVLAVLVLAVLVLAVLVLVVLVLVVALQSVRGDRARAPRTGVHRHTAGPARPGSPDLRHQAAQAGRRRRASTRRPGPVSKRRTDVTGPARRQSHRVR